MSFGADVITFGHLVKTGDPDESGQYQMNTVTVNAPGCRHRPLTFREANEMGFDVNVEYWRSTIPLKDYAPNVVAFLNAIKGNDVISVDGVEYQIVGGVRPFKDMAGLPFKMTIHSILATG